MGSSPIRPINIMFEETARLKFFIPKPFTKNSKFTDKYPFVVMESDPLATMP